MHKSWIEIYISLQPRVRIADSTKLILEVRCVQAEMERGYKDDLCGDNC
jgi:hypothetical protein